MRAMYARALVVVTPSRAEGFSLPGAGGVRGRRALDCLWTLMRTLALLPAAYLFAPDDAAGLARSLTLHTLARGPRRNLPGAGRIMAGIY